MSTNTTGCTIDLTTVSIWQFTAVGRMGAMRTTRSTSHSTCSCGNNRLHTFDVHQFSVRGHPPSIRAGVQWTRSSQHQPLWLHGTANRNLGRLAANRQFSTIYTLDGTFGQCLGQYGHPTVDESGDNLALGQSQ
eukprot:5077452-Amphidinium_carterae.1